MELSGYVYTCAAGETFDSIARDLWWDEKYAAELMCVNPEYCTKPYFDGGEEIWLPAIDLPEEEEEGGKEPEKAPWKE